MMLSLSLSDIQGAPVEAQQVDETDWRKKATIFKALGDKNRQKILHLLRDGEKCVSDLLPHFTILQPTVSTHLLLLEEAGILRVRREGRKRYYSITDPKIYSILDDFRGDIKQITG